MHLHLAALLTFTTPLLTLTGTIVHGGFKIARAADTLARVTRENTGAIKDLTDRQESQERRLGRLETKIERKMR